MDFVAKILIDQQDIAGRMSRGGERCEIDLATMQLIRLPLGISLVVELLFKRGMIIRTWDDTINCLKCNANFDRMVFGVKSIKF